MSDWLSLCWSTSAATAVPSAPPIACQNWTLVALGFFGGLLLEVPTGVPCAATVEPGAAPPPPPAPVVAAAGWDAGQSAQADFAARAPARRDFSRKSPWPPAIFIPMVVPQGHRASVAGPPPA